MKRSFKGAQPAKKRLKPNCVSEDKVEPLDEIGADIDPYFEELTGFPGDLTLIGEDFKVNTHSILLRKSKSIMMVCKQPSNKENKTWYLGNFITKNAAMEFLKLFYEETQAKFINLKPWDWEPYLFLTGQHLDRSSERKILKFIHGRLKYLLKNVNLEESGFDGFKKEIREELTACFEYYTRKEISLPFTFAQQCFCAMADQDDAEEIFQNPFAAWTYVTDKRPLILENYYWWTYGIWGALCEKLPWSRLEKYLELVEWDEISKLEGMKNAVNFFNDYYKEPSAFETEFLLHMIKWCCN